MYGILQLEWNFDWRRRRSKNPCWFSWSAASPVSYSSWSISRFLWSSHWCCCFLLWFKIYVCNLKNWWVKGLISSRNWCLEIEDPPMEQDRTRRRWWWLMDWLMGQRRAGRKSKWKPTDFDWICAKKKEKKIQPVSKGGRRMEVWEEENVCVHILGKITELAYNAKQACYSYTLQQSLWIIPCCCCSVKLRLRQPMLTPHLIPDQRHFVLIQSSSRHTPPPFKMLLLHQTPARASSSSPSPHSWRTHQTQAASSNQLPRFFTSARRFLLPTGLLFMILPPLICAPLLSMLESERRERDLASEKHA